ncbi:MAG: hypothetical protein ACRERC_05305, partial [Candidatus Binatia bacterium]
VQGRLADAAFSAAARTARAWVGARDARLGLLRRELDAPDAHWNYKDSAADCYGHLVIAAHLVAPDLLPALREMLATERRLFPDTIDLASGAVVETSDDQRAFGAAEYAKDGLLPVLECLGQTPWSDRLNEVVEQVWVLGARPTHSGGSVILGQAETNGEILQVVARLWQRTRDPVHLARGRAIVEAYVNEVFPLTGGLPPRDFDFARGVASDARLKLRDHGNEMVAGLVEWTLVERAAPDSRLAVYTPAVEAMLDRLLVDGRDANGLWLDTAGQGARADGMLNDNWGYISSAFVAYALALPDADPRRQPYLDAARRSLRAAGAQRGANWEHGRMDGFADSIESALYLLPYVDEPGAAAWIDEESGRLQAYAQPDGFVTRMYLDGNFIRTSLLYALWKTAGIRPVPWRPGLQLGAERDGAAWHVAVQSDQAWHGVLQFDGPRHRETLGLARNYPRLNAWPEWFAVEPQATYEIEDRVRGTRATFSGAALRRGLDVELPAGAALHWRVTRLEG